MPTNVDLVKFALQKAAELAGHENVRNELRLIAKDKFIYFVAGGQMLVALRCSSEDRTEFVPFDSGLICLN